MNSKNGLLVVLIESTSIMNHEMVLAQPSGASQRVSRCDLLTTAVSRFLEDLAREANVGVIVGGYALDQNGQVSKYSRAGLEVCEYAVETLDAITSSPLETKSVSRHTPNGVISQQIPLHIHVAHQHGSASQAEAFAGVYQILQSLNPATATIINICCSESAGANPLQIVEEIMGSPLQSNQVINVHLGTGMDVAVKYPSQKLALRGLARQLFTRSSGVTAPLAASLKDQKQVILKGARSLVVNASMIDVLELFTAIRHEIINAWPNGELPFNGANPATPDESLEETVLAEPEISDPSVSDLPLLTEGYDLSLPEEWPLEIEQAGVHVIFAVCPGVEDPFSQDAGIAVRKLLDVANETIDSRNHLDASLSLIMISKDSDGDVEAISAFPGDQSQGSAVEARVIRESAVDVVSYTESVSDGAGGLIDIPKKKHVYLRAEPSFACGLDEFSPAIHDLMEKHPARKQFVVFFIAGTPTPADLLAIEALRAGRDCVCLACVWTVGAHSPVRSPLKDLSGLQNSELSSLASQCRVTLNGDEVFALSVNSSKGLSSLLNELAAVII